MSVIMCPSCGHEQEINHDDGYGYDECVEHEQECVKCDYPFKFTTSISYQYEVYCSDGHDMVQSMYKSELWDCRHCDHYEIRSK